MWVRRLRLALATGLVVPLAACSGSDAGGAAAGGASTVGASQGTGGASASAGTGGLQTAGGSSSPGGAIATGGSSAGTAATGGKSATGGSSTAAGTAATGGKNATGGSNSAGGTAATGGSKTAGGNSATGGSKTTGGATAAGGTTTLGGASSTGGSGGVSDCGWPNATSKVISDPWISQHHDQICEMRPKALLLNYANKFDSTQTMTLVNQHIAAWQWATRYHGYKDANAKPFFNYELVKIVDLRDGGTAVTSTKLPTKGANNTGEVDYAQLNSQAYADLIGIQDPDNPGTNLNLCGLFEKGLIHEVWGMVADNGSNGSGNGKFGESAENKVAYNANNQQVSPLRIVNVSNGTDIRTAIPCKVSVRVYDFNPTRGPGCHLHAAGHGWERYVTAGALPALTKVASTFFNFDFKTRFGASFTSFYDVCPYDNQICINWPSNIHAVSGVSSSQAFDFADMSAGCGNVHFYPNATTQYTFAGDVQVLTSCENYGLHNGVNGADLTTPYQSAMAIQDYKNIGADTRTILYDCAGAENAYLFASMPGYGNLATASDGTAMRNWWVYNFY